MFITFLLKLKSMLFGNTSSTFMTVLAAILGLIIMFNADTVLTKFGMQTRSSLAAELSKTQEQLKQVVTINHELNDTITSLRLGNQSAINIVDKNCKESAVISSAISSAKTDLDNRAKKIKASFKPANNAKVGNPASGLTPPPVQTIDDQPPKTVQELVSHLQPEQLNALSNANITAINAAYDDLFKST